MIATARPAPAAVRRGDVALDVLVVRVGLGTPARLQRVGLLVRQVHSIVRMTAGDQRLRALPAGRWQVSYEGAWVPAHSLARALDPDPAPADLLPAGAEGAHLLGIRQRPGPGAGYVGLIVDDVEEILTYPLAQVRAFPRWVAPRGPAAFLWGGIPAADGAVLLLLDATALADRVIR